MSNVHGADRRVHDKLESKKLGICVAAGACLMGSAICLSLKSLKNVHGADLIVLLWQAFKKLFGKSEKPRICVAGAAGLMGSAICRRLKSQGYFVIACDWMKDELLAKDKYWDEYHVIDTMDPTAKKFMDKCLEVTRRVDLVFNFATSGVGPCFRESDLSATKERDARIGYNMAEAARINGVKRFFHASIVYARLPEPKYPTGFETLETEKLCERYYEDFGFECRIGRFYCIYGSEGGRREARAAVRGVPSISTGMFRMGDGPHPIIDGYVEELISLMKSNCHEPVYIGSLNMRELATMGGDETVSEN